VLGVAKNTETGESYVVYVPMYETAEDTDYQFEARPLDMFTESVEYDGKVVPRFRYVSPEL